MRCPNCGYDVITGLHRGRTPIRILDLLHVDAPLNSEQIAAALDVNIEGIRKAVWRLWQRGLIQQIPVPNPPRNGEQGAKVMWELA